MAVCCQNLPLGALSSRSAPSVLVGALFKKFDLFLNTGVLRTLVIKSKRVITEFASFFIVIAADVRCSLPSNDNKTLRTFRHLPKSILIIKKIVNLSPVTFYGWNKISVMGPYQINLRAVCWIAAALRVLTSQKSSMW
jgi:hypothetical protein